MKKLFLTIFILLFVFCNYSYSYSYELFGIEFWTKNDLVDTDDLPEGTINEYDKTVGLTGNSDIQITGTYPNFTFSFINGSGYLSVITGSELDNIWTSNGILTRTGENTYSFITDNSTNWNTAYTDRLKWDGGTTGLTASTGRTSLGATTVGENIFTLTNPSAITFLRINADNTVSSLSDSVFRTAIGAGTSSFDGEYTSLSNIPTSFTPTTHSDTVHSVDYWTEAENTAADYAPKTGSKSFCILDPVATDDYPIWQVPYAITITGISVQCLGGTNIVGQLTECDGEGINAAVVDSSDITATANNSVDDDGTLSNPSIDSGDYVGVKIESVSGDVTSVTFTFDYSY